MSNSDARTRTHGAIFVSMTLLGWSSVPLFLRYFRDYIDAWTANGWRYGIAALVWAPVLIVAASRGTLPKGLWKLAIVPSVINCVGQCCFAWSPYYIDPGLLTFMLRFQIIFVALGAYILFPAERGVIRSARYWFGVAVTFGGSVGVCLLGSELPRAEALFGIGLAIAAGICFGGYSLAVRYYMNGVSSVVAFGAISQYTAFGVVTIMLLIGERRGGAALDLSGSQFGALALSAVAGIALAHVFYYASMARLGVSVAAGVILLQPFFTGAGSWLWFDEHLTTAQWLCGAGAMVGAGFMFSAQRRMHRSAEVGTRSAPDPAPSAAAAS